MEYTMDAYNKLIEQAKVKEQVRFLGKQSEIADVCQAKNEIPQIFKAFQTFLAENKDRIIGKKIMLVDGGYSKLMQTLLDEFGLTLVLRGGDSFYLDNSQNNFKVNITICVSGGKYSHDNDGVSTHYCHYVRESFYDALKCDADGKLLEIDFTEKVKRIYTVDSVNEAIENVKKMKKELEDLKSKIRDIEWNFIPSEINY